MKNGTQTKKKMDLVRRDNKGLCFFEIISVLVIYTSIYANEYCFIQQFIIKGSHGFCQMFTKVIHFTSFVFLRMSIVLLKRIQHANNY